MAALARLGGGVGAGPGGAGSSAAGFPVTQAWRGEELGLRRGWWLQAAVRTPGFQPEFLPT